MIVKIIRKFWWVLAALGAVLAAALRGRNPWRGRAQKAQEAATEAVHEAIDAKADHAKAENNHEANKELDDLGQLSDSELFDDALQRHRRRRGPGAGEG